MKISLLCALFLAAPLAICPGANAQNAVANTGRRADEATLHGTVLSFNEATRALKIAVESRAGEAAPSNPKAPFVTIVLPPDLEPPAALVKRGALVAATGSWAEKGALQARAIRILTLEEALTPPSGHIAAGWPQRVTGSVSGSPVAAQLDGVGPLEVVVASQGDSHDPSAAGVGPVQLWAFDADGKTHADWPVDMIAADKRPAPTDNVWFGSPTVADLDGNVTDEIVMAMPRGTQPNDRGMAVYYGDGTPWRTTFVGGDHPDCWNSVPILDVTGDGEPDVITGRIALTINGKVPAGWPDKATKSAYQTAWADMDGDGDLEGFTSRMEKIFHVAGMPSGQDVIALDHTGKGLPGWPQPVENLSVFTAVGDIQGDDTLEVVCIDWGGTLRAWTLGGQGVPGSRTSRDSLGRELRGGLREGMNGYAPVSLADLDGDGKAEIIALSHGGELLTLKADGSNWGTGRLGRFNGGRAGVAVADVGGDGEMDIFAGNKWIRLTKDGPVSADIAPRDAQIAAAPSLCDLDGDGKAEVLLASEDGRVWVFQTDKEIKPEWVQWQTTSGNFRHTSAWFDPRKITPEIAKWARARFSPND